MIIAFALLVGAIAVAWSGPVLLHRLCTDRTDPGTAIVAWLLSIVGVGITVAASVALLLLPDHWPAGVVINFLHSCWSAFSHGAVPQLDDITGLGGMLAFGVVAVVAVIGVVRFWLRRRRVHRRQLEILRIVARRSPGPVLTMWLDHGQPLAYSVGGRPGFIVVTQGLADRLEDEELAAVLVHETAHLRGRHHTVVGFAEAIADALPFVPLMRQAPEALRALAELAADQAAVRQCGPRAVRNALLTVSAAGVPPEALAMSRDGLEARLRRLDSGACRGNGVSRVSRVLSVIASAAVAVLLPAAVGLTGLAAVGLVFC